MKTQILVAILAGAAYSLAIVGCANETPADQAAISAAISGAAAVTQAYVGQVLTPEIVTYIKQGAGNDATGTLAANTVTNLLPQVGSTLTQDIANVLYKLAATPKTAVTGTTN